MGDLFVVTFLPAMMALAAAANEPACVPNAATFCAVRYVDCAAPGVVEFMSPSGRLKPIVVHIAGLRVPRLETRDACEHEAAVRARDIAHRWLQAVSRVDLRRCRKTPDRFLTCDVEVDGESLAAILLKDGSVVDAYTAPKKPDWCAFLKRLDDLP
jgi:endonuclease YncB( thermonuclease family)